MKEVWKKCCLQRNENTRQTQEGFKCSIFGNWMECYIWSDSLCIECKAHSRWADAAFLDCLITRVEHCGQEMLVHDKIAQHAVSPEKPTLILPSSFHKPLPIYAFLVISPNGVLAE